MSLLNDSTMAQLKEALVSTHLDDDAKLMTALRITAKWRSHKLAATVAQQNGMTVQSGLFAGMNYVGEVAEGALSARLIGSYESELAPHITAFVQAGLDDIVDIGCAEGYYAVGMARLVPSAQVYAYDTDENARKLCADLAQANGVTARVHIGGEFSGDDFAKFAGKRALFIVDIEGGEADLLDPGLYPALKGLKIIVETHPRASPGVIPALVERFSPSHDIQLVKQAPKSTPLPQWLDHLGHLDSLLAVWEWRGTPTPWLVLRPKAAAA